MNPVRLLACPNGDLRAPIRVRPFEGALAPGAVLLPRVTSQVAGESL